MEMTNLNLSFCVLVFGRSWTKFPGSQELQLKSSEDVRQVTVGVKTNTNKTEYTNTTPPTKQNKNQTSTKKQQPQAWLSRSGQHNRRKESAYASSNNLHLTYRPSLSPLYATSRILTSHCNNLPMPISFAYFLANRLPVDASSHMFVCAHFANKAIANNCAECRVPLDSSPKAWYWGDFW